MSWRDGPGSSGALTLVLMQHPSLLAAEGELRLGNGVMAADGSAEYGRLEVFYNGGWGTVCDNESEEFLGDRRSIFTDASADVACRQLGYLNGFQIQVLVRGSHIR